LGDDFAGCGIDGRESFAGRAVDPLAVDEQLGSIAVVAVAMK
jgi:hypothetical protein